MALKREIKFFAIENITQATTKDAIYLIKASTDTTFKIVATDLDGNIVNLFQGSTGGGITNLTSTDSSILITGSAVRDLKISSALQSIINSALQSGDPITSLANNAGYITLADIPAFVPGDYDLDQFTNNNADPFLRQSDQTAGTTNLGYTPAPNQGTVTSDTGNDAIIPLGDGTNAGVSLNDYTTAEKNKLAGIENGAEVNNISDTNATDLTDGGDSSLHHHDSRYYTETETDNLLAGKESTITGTGNITDFWSGNKTFRNLATDVRAVALTGLSLATSQTISATDTMLQAFGYIQAQITARVIGAASSTDNAITRFDGTTGKTVQNSLVTIDDNGAITVPGETSPTHTAKSIKYDNTLNQWILYDNDVNVALNVGYETWFLCTNNTGVSIPNGSVVYISGASSGVPTIALAKADSATTAVGIGITTETIVNGATGKVTQSGLINGVNTSTLSAGAVYVSSTTAGALTNTPPTAPNYRMRVGFIGVINASTGTILVTPSTAALGNGALDQLLKINASGLQEWTDLKTFNGVTLIGSGDLRTKWKNGSDGTSVANTLTITPTYSQLIDGGKVILGDVMSVAFRWTSPGAKTSATNAYIYINTANNLTGATQIGMVTSSATNRTLQIQRKLVIKGATTKVINPVASVANDDGGSSAMTAVTIDWTQNQYILFAIGHTVNDQTSFGDFYSIELQ